MYVLDQLIAFVWIVKLTCCFLFWFLFARCLPRYVVKVKRIASLIGRSPEIIKLPIIIIVKNLMPSPSLYNKTRDFFSVVDYALIKYEFEIGKHYVTRPKTKSHLKTVVHDNFQFTKHTSAWSKLRLSGRSFSDKQKFSLDSSRSTIL